MARGGDVGATARGPSAHARICMAAALLLTASVPELAPAEAAGRQTAVAAPAGAVPVPELGIKLAPLTPELRKRYAIDHAYAGPVVVEVEADGPAARALNAGDEIVQIGSELVSAPEDVEKAMEGLRQPGRASAVLDVVSPEGYLRFVSIRLRSPDQPANKS